MQKIADLIHRSVQRLGQSERPVHEARLIIGRIVGQSEAWVFANGEKELTQEQVSLVELFIERRACHEPLAKILGEKNFWKYSFKTTQATLDPRPDSEVLIEAVLASFLDQNQAFRILELGVGTGCLIISFLLERPHATGVGVDISKAALQIAQDNSQRLGACERLLLVNADWLEAIGGPFECIISNPPYIPTSEIKTLSADVREFDPLGALDGGVDGLDYYRRFFKSCLPSMMTENGKVFMECGLGQSQEIIEASQGSSVVFSKSYNDLQGIARVLEFQMSENFSCKSLKNLVR
jgi:release factor glutamine methyltransferase